MPRWITFDEKSADGLRSRVPPESVFEAPGRTALEYALSSSGRVVAVLNPRIGNQCAVALFHRPPSEAPIAPATRAVRASGILGLGDEDMFEEEEEPRTKNWWRRLWED